MASDTQTERFPIGTYTLFGNYDPKKVSTLHKMVVDFHDRFLTDHAVQNIILHGGYEGDGERPQSYHDVMDQVFPRSRVSLHLQTLDFLVDAYTIPPLIIAEDEQTVHTYSPGDLLFSDLPLDSIRFKTSSGWDAGRVEEAQRLWFENPDVTSSIREYRRALSDSFDQFNLKLILYGMYRERNGGATIDWEPERSLMLEIDKALETEKGSCQMPPFSILDNAYYDTAKRFSRKAGKLYEALETSEFGKQFLLTREEEMDFFKGR